MVLGTLAACGGAQPASTSTGHNSPTATIDSSGPRIDPKHPELAALDLADGRVRWVQKLDKLTYGLSMVGDRLIEAGAGACGQTRAHLRAVDVPSGKQLWSVDYPQPGLMGRPGFAAGGDVAVVSEASNLVAFSLADGSERWRHAFPAAPRPAVVGGVVVAAAETMPPVSPPTVEAFRLTDGQPVWTATGLPALQVLDLSPVGGVVFVGGYSGSPMTYVLDAATGAMRWSQPAGLAAGAGDLAVTFRLGQSAPSASAGAGAEAPATDAPAATDALGGVDAQPPTTDGPVAIGVVGLDAETGRTRWTTSGDGAAVTSAGVVTWIYGAPPASPPPDGSVPFIPSALTGVDPADGSRRWSSDGEVAAVVGDVALLFPNETTLEAVGLRDGAVRWHLPWPKSAVRPSVGSDVSAAGEGIVALALPGTDASPAPGCGD